MDINLELDKMDMEQEKAMELVEQEVDIMEVQQAMYLTEEKLEQEVHHLYREMKIVMQFQKNQLRKI